MPTQDESVETASEGVIADEVTVVGACASEEVPGMLEIKDEEGTDEGESVRLGTLVLERVSEAS